MPRWTVRIGDPAENDFADIIAFTAESFGARQAAIYQTTLKLALKALTAGPDVRRNTARDDIAKGLRTLHVARSGRRGRHLIVYRAAPGRIIVVLCILHDAMDLKQHVPKSE